MSVRLIPAPNRSRVRLAIAPGPVTRLAAAQPEGCGRGASRGDQREERRGIANTDAGIRQCHHDLLGGGSCHRNFHRNCLRLLSGAGGVNGAQVVSPTEIALPALPPELMSCTETAPPLADEVATPPLPADAVSTPSPPPPPVVARLLLPPLASEMLVPALAEMSMTVSLVIVPPVITPRRVRHRLALFVNPGTALRRRLRGWTASSRQRARALLPNRVQHVTAVASPEPNLPTPSPVPPANNPRPFLHYGARPPRITG